MANPLWHRFPGLVWSNAQAGDEVYIRAALLDPRFETLLAIALVFGLARLEEEWALLSVEKDARTVRVQSQTERMLRNLRTGFDHAEA